jgi:DNA-binding MarR family transcriptional regulator
VATPTVNESRTDALLRRLARLDSEPAREAVVLGLVDALLDGDAGCMAACLDALRDARAGAADDRELTGWLDATVAFAHWGLERVPSQAELAAGTQAHDFLRALDGAPQVGSAELRRRLEVDETQVSRTGRRLLEAGLVARSKVGRQVFWQLTPRGRRVLEQAPARRSSGSEFWREALRRGFAAACGEPVEPRDPTGERIIETALELHGTIGIRATTREDIAERSGVPLETIEAMFPTLDDLARGCGRHFMESLQLPPQERAPEIFVRASSEHERVHRLVETVFDAYERGAPGLAAGRREARDVPAVQESMEALDGALDALVAEALRPLRPDGTSVATLRGLTDLEVWRSLREQGVTQEAAVDRASEAVERWLEAYPGR